MSGVTVVVCGCFDFPLQCRLLSKISVVSCELLLRFHWLSGRRSGLNLPVVHYSFKCLLRIFTMLLVEITIEVLLHPLQKWGFTLVRLGINEQLSKMGLEVKKQ